MKKLHGLRADNLIPKGLNYKKSILWEKHKGKKSESTMVNSTNLLSEIWDWDNSKKKNGTNNEA